MSGREEKCEANLKELRSKLTPNQRMFADEYLIDRNGTQSYLKAYPNVKKEAAARTNASKLLTNANVAAYVEAHLEEISKKAAMTVEQILIEESRIASSDIRKLFDGEFVLISPGELDEDTARAIAGVEIREQDIFNDDGEVIQTITTYKYKFWDKGQALNRLEKIHGLHQPKDAGLEAGLEKLGDRLAAAIERVKK